MKKEYGDLSCYKGRRSFLIRFPAKIDIKDMDTVTLMAGMWLIENYLLATEDDPVLAAKIIFDRMQKILKEKEEEEPVG